MQRCQYGPLIGYKTCSSQLGVADPNEMTKETTNQRYDSHTHRIIADDGTSPFSFSSFVQPGALPIDATSERRPPPVTNCPITELKTGRQMFPTPTKPVHESSTAQ